MRDDDRHLRKRGFSQQEIDLFRAARDRVAFAKQYIQDNHGRPWEPRAYQRASLLSDASRKVHCDGRDVGKTAEIEIVACWAMVNCPDSEMLIATQCENHLFPLMNRLVRRFQTSDQFASSLVEVRRSPSWYFRFSNGFVLWGRIAGPHGVNFQGLHVDWQIVDEAQEMTETSWGELYQALNGGGRRWVYGVPNGLRNTFYRMTQMHDVEQYNWPSSLNPEFSAEKDEELARLYGGRNAPGYVHRVLGQHGEPACAVFVLEDYLACVQSALPFHNLVLAEGDAFEAPTGVPNGDYFLGCDLGYARDPSEFVVYHMAGPDLVNVARVKLVGVNYARQQDVIVALDRAYSFRAIGIDAGNNGRAVAHNLMRLGNDWCDRVYAYEFGSTRNVGLLPNGQSEMRRTKEFMTELLTRRMAERTLVFPSLADREEQYASHTYRITEMGQVVYEKGNDHLVDADRCAMLAQHEWCTELECGTRPALPMRIGLFKLPEGY